VRVVWSSRILESPRWLLCSPVALSPLALRSKLHRRQGRTLVNMDPPIEMIRTCIYMSKVRLQLHAHCSLYCTVASTGSADWKCRFMTLLSKNFEPSVSA
jgi:hypothetical protein